MGDLFHESVPFEWILKVFEVAKKCQRHTFQILTKRPENIIKWIQLFNSMDGADYPFFSDWIPGNVWFGTTIENQNQIRRIEDLLKIPAKVHFVSAEPLLSELNMVDWLDYCDSGENIDWVISGPETGPELENAKRNGLNLYTSNARPLTCLSLIKRTC